MTRQELEREYREQGAPSGSASFWVMLLVVVAFIVEVASCIELWHVLKERGR